MIGITSADVKDLKFKWMAARTIYSILFILLSTIEGLLMVARAFRKGLQIKYAGGFVY